MLLRRLRHIQHVVGHLLLALYCIPARFQQGIKFRVFLRPRAIDYLIEAPVHIGDLTMELAQRASGAPIGAGQRTIISSLVEALLPLIKPPIPLCDPLVSLVQLTIPLTGGHTRPVLSAGLA